MTSYQALTLVLGIALIIIAVRQSWTPEMKAIL